MSTATGIICPPESLLRSAKFMLLLLIGALGLSSEAPSASFDCKQARTFLEKGICQDETLSRLDDKLGALYSRWLASSSNQATVKADQQTWLVGTRNACEDSECLTRVYLARIAKIEQQLSQQPAGPVTSSRNSSKDACTFPSLALPPQFLVFAAGGYTGRELPYQIDQSGHQATQFDVAVHNPNVPVVLILGAYEPTIWNVKWTRQTSIVAVMISGYHRQAIAGLHPGVPVLNSSYDNKGACGYHYVASNSLSGLNPLSRRLFNRAVDMVYLSENRKGGSIFIGERMAEQNYVNSKEVTVESFFDKSAPMAGPAGLEDAVQKGYLRKATAADAQEWVTAVMAANPNDDTPMIAGAGKAKPPTPSMHNGYVVLKKFTFPAGLYGGNSATFFIPKGVPVPSGNPGHSQVYDFNRLKCIGMTCRTE